MNIYQNDIVNCKGVPKEGCLFMSLIDCVAEENKKEPSIAKIENCYHAVSQQGGIGDENNKYIDGAYVWDHEMVLNTMQGVLSLKDKDWTYLACIWTPFEESRGKKNYIPHPDYTSRATHMIIQIQTVFGGHFRRLDYDPWRSKTKARYIKSIRYYECK